MPVNIAENVVKPDEDLVNFVATEVSTSLTFARLAQDSRDADKRQRNLANAQEGYDTALHYLREASNRNDRVSPHIVEGMIMLRSMLREMGQRG